MITSLCDSMGSNWGTLELLLTTQQNTQDTYQTKTVKITYSNSERRQKYKQKEKYKDIEEDIKL